MCYDACANLSFSPTGDCVMFTPPMLYDTIQTHMQTTLPDVAASQRTTLHALRYSPAAIQQVRDQGAI